MSRDRLRLIVLALALAVGAEAVTAGDVPPGGDAGDPSSALLALTCDDLGPAAVRDVLAQADAPRVILLSGSLPMITMDPFARFLVAMGYPAERLRAPDGTSLSQSGYQDSVKLAGVVAWYYEHDGMAPMMIGHSRGGMLVVRTLHELAGAFQDAVPVWDPVADEPLPRTTIVDPYSGRERPVIGLSVDYAAAIAAGRLPRLLLGQWAMLRRLHAIPDTVREFTGYTIPGDLVAGTLFDREPYAAQGTAHVRNVELPATTLHIDAPRVAHLAAEPAMRAWIEAYRPGRVAPLPAGDTTNLLEAADVWYGVRTAWCRAAQARARHALAGEAGS